MTSNKTFEEDKVHQGTSRFVSFEKNSPLALSSTRKTVYCRTNIPDNKSIPVLVETIEGSNPFRQTWHIRVDHAPVINSQLAIGIANENYTNYESGIGWNSVSWGFYSSGEFCHNGQTVYTNVDFRSTDILSIQLDLMEEGPKGRGVLSFIRHREEKMVCITAFSGLCCETRLDSLDTIQRECSRFYPVVQLKHAQEQMTILENNYFSWKEISELDAIQEASLSLPELTKEGIVSKEGIISDAGVVSKEGMSRIWNSSRTISKPALSLLESVVSTLFYLLSTSKDPLILSALVSTLLNLWENGKIPEEYRTVNNIQTIFEIQPCDVHFTSRSSIALLILRLIQPPHMELSLSSMTPQINMCELLMERIHQAKTPLEKMTYVMSFWLLLETTTFSNCNNNNNNNNSSRSSSSNFLSLPIHQPLLSRQLFQHLKEEKNHIIRVLLSLAYHQLDVKNTAQHLSVATDLLEVEQKMNPNSVPYDLYLLKKCDIELIKLLPKILVSPLSRSKGGSSFLKMIATSILNDFIHGRPPKNLSSTSRLMARNEHIYAGISFRLRGLQSRAKGIHRFEQVLMVNFSSKVKSVYERLHQHRLLLEDMTIGGKALSQSADDVDFAERSMIEAILGYLCQNLDALSYLLYRANYMQNNLDQEKLKSMAHLIVCSLFHDTFFSSFEKANAIGEIISFEYRLDPQKFSWDYTWHDDPNLSFSIRLLSTYILVCHYQSFLQQVISNVYSQIVEKITFMDREEMMDYFSSELVVRLRLQKEHFPLEIYHIFNFLASMAEGFTLSKEEPEERIQQEEKSVRRKEILLKLFLMWVKLAFHFPERFVSYDISILQLDKFIQVKELVLETLPLLEKKLKDSSLMEDLFPLDSTFSRFYPIHPRPCLHVFYGVEVIQLLDCIGKYLVVCSSTPSSFSSASTSSPPSSSPPLSSCPLSSPPLSSSPLSSPPLSSSPLSSSPLSCVGGAGVGVGVGGAGVGVGVGVDVDVVLEEREKSIVLALQKIVYGYLKCHDKHTLPSLDDLVSENPILLVHVNSNWKSPSSIPSSNLWNNSMNIAVECILKLLSYPRCTFDNFRYENLSYNMNNSDLETNLKEEYNASKALFSDHQHASIALSALDAVTSLQDTNKNVDNQIIDLVEQRIQDMENEIEVIKQFTTMSEYYCQELDQLNLRYAEMVEATKLIDFIHDSESIKQFIQQGREEYKKHELDECMCKVGLNWLNECQACKSKRILFSEIIEKHWLEVHLEKSQLFNKTIRDLITQRKEICSFFLSYSPRQNGASRKSTKKSNTKPTWLSANNPVLLEGIHSIEWKKWKKWLKVILMVHIGDILSKVVPQDNDFYQQLTLLQYILPSDKLLVQLSVHSTSFSVYVQAVQLLKKLEFCSFPSDKLSLIKSFQCVLSQIYQKDTSKEEFYDMLVFNLIQARPSRLFSDLKHAYLWELILEKENMDIDRHYTHFSSFLEKHELQMLLIIALYNFSQNHPKWVILIQESLSRNSVPRQFIHYLLTRVDPAYSKPFLTCTSYISNVCGTVLDSTKVQENDLVVFSYGIGRVVNVHSEKVSIRLKWGLVHCQLSEIRRILDYIDVSDLICGCKCDRTAVEMILNGHLENVDLKILSSLLVNDTSIALLAIYEIYERVVQSIEKLHSVYREVKVYLPICLNNVRATGMKKKSLYSTLSREFIRKKSQYLLDLLDAIKD